jgi:hypothetical protein
MFVTDATELFAAKEHKGHKNQSKKLGSTSSVAIFAFFRGEPFICSAMAAK